ncbi:dihydrofolate reductase [Nesterenkonia sp. NBAIMH1]|uniref:dihydrofolate reductase n=1 Tax=Nesterenkonia sp. NBAIMH1 TaxID=2600320 RepID=UPI001FF044CE|nr:dihydrofolate reductase [Nesterenkonia sp. NBAIMH1]
MIWAQTPERVIGADGGMPWHVPEDLAYFKSITAGCPVVMGRRTWESLPERFRPLPGRVNIVVTRSAEQRGRLAGEGAVPAESLEEALDEAREHVNDASSLIWIMGGGGVYAEAVERDLADLASVTIIDTDAPGDTYAPELHPSQWVMAGSAQGEGSWDTSESGTRYRFETYRRV